MIKLKEKELIKIFKKKTIYITLIVVALLMIFINCMYKFSSNIVSSYYGYSEEYAKMLEEELKNLDPEKPSDVSMYINYKTEIEISKYMNKYKESPWKTDIISRKLSSYISEKNNYKYGLEKDEEKAKELENQINEIISKLESDNWKYFANEDLETANKKIEDINNQKKMIEDKQVIQNLESELKSAEIEKEIAEYRLNKDIPYGNDYLNMAMNNLQTAITNINNYENLDRDLNYEEKTDYQANSKRLAESRYILDNKVDINKTDSAKGILQDFYSQFGLFLIVIIVMIAGTIVSEEFNKGTIKLLLVKPYTRNKILLAKFVTVLIMIVFTILVTMLMQTLIGGVLFGFDSLSTPVVTYNYDTNTMQEFNIFVYFMIKTLTQLPIIILLATLAFSISTLFSNSALAITISLLGYMSNLIINQLVLAFNLKFMKYFVTMNWDLNQYLFGKLPDMEGMNMTMSILICIAYFIIMIVPTFIVFKKKNIKNI